MIKNGSKWRRYSRPGKIDTFLQPQNPENDQKWWKIAQNDNIITQMI